MSMNCGMSRFSHLMAVALGGGGGGTGCDSCAIATCAETISSRMLRIVLRTGSLTFLKPDKCFREVNERFLLIQRASEMARNYWPSGGTSILNFYRLAPLGL